MAKSGQDLDRGSHCHACNLQKMALSCEAVGEDANQEAFLFQI
jgi:hypothetical protein